MEKVDKGPGLEGEIEEAETQTQGAQSRSPSPQISVGAPSSFEDGHQQDLAGGELPAYPIADMLKALSMEVKGGFETSINNQEEIRSLCETLGEKTDDLAGRTAALEEQVGELKSAMEVNRVEIQKLNSIEESILSKLEILARWRTPLARVSSG
ncbi:hypothetical protein NDU88_006938 [Pleurodeles waltl]|uniref:Uncharacterized protein n=1 Tax=Pleurodeles waltl TaxID=8319 RepID=A0AAV7UPM0_PLEWA|nr:hypothetical protein NDU88_006938 [Pleurodeles waltl]